MDATTPPGVSNEVDARTHARPMQRLVDAPDGPARPLGAKRSGLLAQKRRKQAAVWRAGLTGSSATPRGQVLSAPDGMLAFAVVPTQSGLIVERSHCTSTGKRSVQTMCFDSVDEFDRWCDAEPARFTTPLLHSQLRREGHAVLERR
jgi:hypothetical protein